MPLLLCLTWILRRTFPASAAILHSSRLQARPRIPQSASRAVRQDCTASLRGVTKDKGAESWGSPSSGAEARACWLCFHVATRDAAQEFSPITPPVHRTFSPWRNCSGPKPCKSVGSGWLARSTSVDKSWPTASGEPRSREAPWLSDHVTLLAPLQGHPVPLGVMALLGK